MYYFVGGPRGQAPHLIRPSINQPVALAGRPPWLWRRPRPAPRPGTGGPEGTVNLSASSLLSRLSRLRYRLNQGAPSSGLLRSSSNLGGPAALGPPILMAIYRGGGPAPHWTPIAVSSCSGNSCTPNSNHLSVDHQSITSLPPCPISTVGEHSLTCPTLSPPLSLLCT